MEIRKFLSVNLADTFFDSLKDDYPEFEEWFRRKSVQGEEAIVQYDEECNSTNRKNVILSVLDSF